MRKTDFGERWSKSTIHEALLDLWMEANGKDCHPDQLTGDDWNAYAAEVLNRSQLRQGADT